MFVEQRGMRDGAIGALLVPGEKLRERGALAAVNRH